MKKKIFILFAAAGLAFNGIAQKNDSIVVTGEEYIPVEGRGETPGKLEGNWIFKSGLKASNKEKSKEVYKPKPSPGKEVKRESVTTTQTKGGVTTTTTETEIELVGKPAKQITQPQGSKMHKPLAPSISFFGNNLTFSGFTGCNKFSGRYTTNGNKLSIKASNPSTKMECIGDYNEKDFLNKINKVNSYRISNGRLELMQGSNVLLVFGRR